MLFSSSFSFRHNAFKHWERIKIKRIKKIKNVDDLAG